jgi:Domain of unknown function (DUF4352)
VNVSRDDLRASGQSLWSAACARPGDHRQRAVEETASATPNTVGRMFSGRLAALLALLAAGMLVGACHTARTTSSPPGMGQEAIDGNFAFIVTQLNSSQTFADKRAQGVYEIVSMSVRNVGAQAQFFEWAAQRLKDSTGRKYSANFMVPPLFGNVVNSIGPGLQVSLKLAFDVPPGTKPTQVVLRESVSSHGAQVNLTQPPSPPPAHG